MRTIYLTLALISGFIFSNPLFAQDEAAAPAEQAADQTAGAPAEVMINYIPDYHENLTIFYFLLSTAIILVFIIIGMSGTIRTLVNSDYFKKNLTEKNSTGLKTILAIVGIGGFAVSSHALTFNGPGEAAEKMPWLLVENSDLYYLTAINLVLLGVVFYFRKMFNEFTEMVRDQKAAEENPVPSVITKVNTVLTDAVPIEEEASILMKHEYDGIRELDNNLPPWWVWGFYATIIFAFVYLINYHVIGVSDLQAEAYVKEMKQAEQDIAAYREKMAMNVDESNVTLMTDATNLGTGKGIFLKNCASCHKDNGSGDNGPNLTDKMWIYGFDIKDVFSSVKNGRPGGMPEHNSKLNPVEIQQVASFVLSLPEAAGKEAQGEIVEK